MTTKGFRMDEFSPTAVRFIKLGEKGKWEKQCIEQDGTIRLGYESRQHQESLNRDWTAVRDYWCKARNGDSGAATRDLNQIRDFYELPSTALWITFYNRLLYWCFAAAKVDEFPDGSRIRKATDGWSCNSLTDKKLHVENIDGRITKVQGYRGTICSVDLEDYLVRKIRGEVQPEVAEANAAIETLRLKAAQLIRGLWWHDFELLADLIFAQAGWQRVSVIGKTEKDIDLDLLSPVTNRRAFVQVKSRADFAMLQQSISAFRSNQNFGEMYFVVHTADEQVLNHSESGVNVLGLDKLAELTINAGLMNWLLKKRE